jgi:hypothetical protein
MVGGYEDLHHVVQEQQQSNVAAQPSPYRPLGEGIGQRRVRQHLAEHPEFRRSFNQGLDKAAAVAAVAEPAFPDAVQIDEVGVRRAVRVRSAGVGHAGRKCRRGRTPARGVGEHLVTGKQCFGDQDRAEPAE